MKKILLASTILVGSAGVAAADVGFSGDAFMGIETYDGGATWAPIVTASMDVAMSGETDGGLAFGADFTITAGGYNAGSATAVTSFLGYAAGGVGDAGVWISGDFGRVSLTDNGTNTTLGYEHSFGDFGVEFNYIFNPGATWNIELSYDMGDYSAYVNTNSAGVTGIGGDAAFGDFSVALDIGNIALVGTTWELGLGYASGAVSVDLTLAPAGAWALDGAWDMGGGAAVEAGFASTGHYSLGVAMEF